MNAKRFWALTKGGIMESLHYRFLYLLGTI